MKGGLREWESERKCEWVNWSEAEFVESNWREGDTMRFRLRLRLSNHEPRRGDMRGNVSGENGRTGEEEMGR